jgi:hypothetical protein
VAAYAAFPTEGVNGGIIDRADTDPVMMNRVIMGDETWRWSAIARMLFAMSLFQESLMTKPCTETFFNVGKNLYTISALINGNVETGCCRKSAPAHLFWCRRIT